MRVSVLYRGGTRYDVTSGSHQIVTDQPMEDGGRDEGMSPVELFVGSLASCVGYFVGRYCIRHEIPCEGLRIEADWKTAEKPHRVGEIALAIHLPYRLTPEQEERLLKVAHGCTVHQSIAVAPSVSIELRRDGASPENQ